MTEPDDDERRERAAILARRQRFVAAALSGITTSTLATACACLKVATVESPAAAPDAGESEADDLTPVEDGGAPLTLVRQAIQMSAAEPKLKRRAGAKGAESDDILAEAGYDSAEIVALRRDGVI